MSVYETNKCFLGTLDYLLGVNLNCLPSGHLYYQQQYIIFYLYNYRQQL